MFRYSVPNLCTFGLVREEAMNVLAESILMTVSRRLTLFSKGGTSNVPKVEVFGITLVSSERIKCEVDSVSYLISPYGYFGGPNYEKLVGAVYV